MRSLFGAGDSDSEPDAKGKPDASLGEASKSHADAGAGAGDAQAPDIMPVVVWHDTMMAAPAMAESIVAAATGVQANTPAPIEAAASDVVAEVALPRADVAAPDDATAQAEVAAPDEATVAVLVGGPEGASFETGDACAGMHVWESDSDDSDFDHGPVERELRTGRHSKLEGRFHGCEQVGALTLHTKFEAAPGASAGYKTLERGMAVDAEGSPVDTWLVRVVAGTVAGSARGKPQWKYVALLQSDEYDEATDTAYHNWYYSPLQKLTPLVPIETSSGKVACNADGTQKRSFNGNRHAADKALAAWVPQSINTLSRKAGELTPRVARATKKARAS
jgi:hypothetical protein